MVHDYGEELEVLTHVIEQTFNARIGVVLNCWLETAQSGVGSQSVYYSFGPLYFPLASYQPIELLKS